MVIDAELFHVCPMRMQGVPNSIRCGCPFRCKGCHHAAITELRTKNKVTKGLKKSYPSKAKGGILGENAAVKIVQYIMDTPGLTFMNEMLNSDYYKDPVWFSLSLSLSVTLSLSPLPAL